MIKKYKQLLSIITSLLLVFAPALSAAGVEVDGTTNTTLESAPNGVDVVNIADPSAQGLSHNRYNHYNVSKEGLILNNSMDTTVKTQLGGFIYGNSHLTSNAKVILNEVTSTNPSQLNGYTEVAGKRADLVIANPNGITLNGAGFINTSNITLSTGKPTIKNGTISSYGTQIGEIAIEGEGLDATQTDSAHLYAKVLRLNANIYANELDAKFGSLDASTLGGMYANAITLEGTDHGVGVNLPPEVVASNGDIIITADGSIKLQKMTAHNIAVQSTQNIELENEIYTSNSARLEAGDEVIVKDGMLASQNSLDIKAERMLNQNILQSTNSLSIEAAQYIQNDADILSDGLLQLVLNGELINNGQISANDLEIGTDTFTNNQTLFAANDMNLYVSKKLQNNQNANIFAFNNLTIAANKANEKTDLIENVSGNIETYNGDINIFAKQLINKRVKDVDDNVFYTSNSFSDSVYFNESIGYSRASVVGENGLLVLKGEGRNDTFGAYVNDFGYHLFIDLAREPFSTHFASLKAVLKEKLPYDNPNYGRSTILAGNDLHIVSDSVLNEISDIVSTNDMYIDVDSFENREKAYEGTLSLTLYNSVDCDAEPERCLLYDDYSLTGIIKKRHDGRLYQDGKLVKSAAYYGDYTYGPYAVKRDDVSLPANVSAGGSIYGNINTLNNGTIQEDTTILKPVPLDIASTTPLQNMTEIPLPQDDNGFFVLSKDPQSSYIIETNPEFTIYENFIGSDYMLEHIGYDAEATTKRLGDALYENRLVRDSVLEQTGQRFLKSEFTSDNEQYKYLMDNAIQASQDLHLAPGIALTKEQINALTKDIVWMQEQEVEGQKVLVPVVYIANAQNYELKGSRIIAANDMDVTTVELNNAGSIKAGNINISATDTINNVGGDIEAAQDMALQATNDITNTSASIKADNIALTSTQGSIINERAQKEVSWKKGMEYSNYTLTGEASSIEAANTLNINANKNLHVTGSSLSAKELNIAASDVEIKTTEDKSDFFIGDSDNYNKANFTKHLSSNINADNVNIDAIESVKVIGSNIDADGNLDIQSKKLDVLAVKNSSYSEIKRTKKGTFSTKSSLDIGLKEQVQGSNIEADNLHVNTTKDINLESVNINVDNSIDLASQEGNVNMSAKTYTNAEYHESSKSSFGGLVGSRSIDSWSKTKLGDSVTTAKNNIVVDGKNINLVANDINAKAGSVQFNAQEDINIASGLEQSDEQHIKESTGLSFGISGGKFTYAQTTKDSKTDTIITNKASNIDADNIVLTSKGSTNILASNLDAKTMQVTSEKDFNILSDQDVKMHNEEHSKKDIGIELTLNTKEASLFAGYWEDAKGETTTSKDVAKSTLNVGSLDVSAKNVNIAGSDVFTNDMSIDSENTKVLSSTATTDTQSYTKSVKSGISVGVKQNISDAIDSMKNIADAKEATGGISRTLKAYDAVNSFMQKPVDAGVYAVYEQSSTNTQTSMEQAVASNLYAANNMILRSDENIEVGGSTIYAANNLNIEAKNIDIHSTTQNYSQETSSDSRNAKVGLFGTKMGEVTLGFQDASQSMQATTKSNSYIVSGDKATITSTEDIALKGALVSANDLEVNVGRDLVMESVQDTQSIQGESKGGTVSGNIATMTPTGASANYGTTSGDKKWVNEVTSLNGQNSVKVSVADTTTLKGASITNMDANGIDQGNLILSTNTLKSEDIHDHDNYTSTNVGVGFGSVDSKPSLNSIDFANSTKEKEQIVRATGGQGTISTDSDTSNLNRDITKTKQIIKDESSNIELYASSSSLQALSDPLQAYDDLKQKAEDLGLASYKEIVENLPSASKIADESKKDDSKDTREKVNDFIDNTIGSALDTLGTLTLGAIPNVENAGGYITQIATQLFGDNRQSIVVNDKAALLKAGVQEKDIQEVILLKTKDGVKELNDLKADEIVLDSATVFRTDPNKTVIIGDPSEKTGNPNLEAYKIRLSEEDIKNSGIKHIFTNGMFNSIETAIYNQQTQQGYADGMLNYNQQHGIIGDLLESAQDALVVNTGISSLGTGGSRQTGEAITQMTQITKGDLTVGAHSQGTLMSQVGMTQNIEELSNIVQSNPESKFLVGYAGSPVNHNEGEALVTEIYGGEEGIVQHFGENAKISNAFRSQVAPEDFVGSVLGWQSAGVNNSENLSINIFESLISAPKLFGIGGDSSHSYYPCIIGYGNDNIIPQKDFYIEQKTFNTKQEMPLMQYYKNNFTNESGQISIDLNLLPQTENLDIQKAQQ